MTLINKARRELSALQQTNNIEFLEIDNSQLIAFHKWSLDGQNKALIVISLDQYYTQKGWVKVPLYHWGIHEGHNVRVIDQITGNSYNWDREWCYVELHPVLPFHIFEVKL
jgi:starch synthase (maltosyl-transferring)